MLALLEKQQAKRKPWLLGGWVCRALPLVYPFFFPLLLGILIL